MRLSGRQLRLLAAIAAFADTYGYAASWRELGAFIPSEASGRPASTSVVSYNLDQLREYALVQFDDRITRSERITPAGRGSSPACTGSSAGR